MDVELGSKNEDAMSTRVVKTSDAVDIDDVSWPAIAGLQNQIIGWLVGLVRRKASAS
jgi:hypothetical protein